MTTYNASNVSPNVNSMAHFRKSREVNGDNWWTWCKTNMKQNKAETNTYRDHKNAFKREPLFEGDVSGDTFPSFNLGYLQTYGVSSRNERMELAKKYAEKNGKVFNENDWKDTVGIPIRLNPECKGVKTQAKLVEDTNACREFYKAMRDKMKEFNEIFEPKNPGMILPYSTKRNKQTNELKEYLRFGVSFNPKYPTIFKNGLGALDPATGSYPIMTDITPDNIHEKITRDSLVILNKVNMYTTDEHGMGVTLQTTIMECVVIRVKPQARVERNEDLSDLTAELAGELEDHDPSKPMAGPSGEHDDEHDGEPDDGEHDGEDDDGEPDETTVVDDVDPEGEDPETVDDEDAEEEAPPPSPPKPVRGKGKAAATKPPVSKAPVRGKGKAVANASDVNASVANAFA